MGGDENELFFYHYKGDAFLASVTYPFVFWFSSRLSGCSAREYYQPLVSGFAIIP